MGAICAAPTVLNEANVVKGKSITSYPSEKATFKESKYIAQNVVKDENVITSRGVGTAIEFALVLVIMIIGIKVRFDLAAKFLWDFLF